MSTALKRRLREHKHGRAVHRCAQVLDGIGVFDAERRFLDLDEIDSLWPLYLAALRDSQHKRRWEAQRVEDVQRCVDELNQRAAGQRLVWLTLVDGEPVGADVPAEAVLGASLSYLVSRAADLMLTSHDAANGVCIELNCVAKSEEYEVAGWGLFAM